MPRQDQATQGGTVRWSSLGASSQASASVLGADRLQALEADLRTITPPDFFRLDAPGWFGEQV